MSDKRHLTIDLRKRPLVVRCAWCEDKPTEIDLSVSHGICESCKAKLLAKEGK